MKRLYKLLLPLCSTIAIAPTFLATSCAPTYKPSMYQVKFSKDSVSKSLKECSKLNKSLQELICGTNSFHSGNYMLILGSECSEASNEIFSEEPEFNKTHYDYSSTNAFVDSVFYHSINKESFKNSNVDFGLVLYIDIESATIANKDLLRPDSEQYRAFDEKWTTEDVKEAENRDINTKEKEVIVEGEYKRKDKSASTMRRLLDYLKTVFPSSDLSTCDSSHMAYGLVWKEGIPQKDYFKQIPNSCLSASTYFDDILELWNQKD